MKLVDFHMQSACQELGTFIALRCEKCKTFVKPWQNLSKAKRFLHKRNAIFEGLLEGKMSIIFNDFNNLQKSSIFYVIGVRERVNAREKKNLKKIARAWHGICMSEPSQ